MPAEHSPNDAGPVNDGPSSLHKRECEKDQREWRKDHTSILRDALNDKAVELVSHLLGAEPNRRLSNRRVKRWGRKGSFAIEVTGHKRGLYFDHEAQEGGDLFNLIRKYQVRDFAGAVQWARDWLGWGDSPAPEPRKAGILRREREEREAREAAQQALANAARGATAKAKFAEARPIEGTMGEVYLRETRGIGAAAALPDAFRWHERARAVICAVTNEEGEIAAAQMIAVTLDGKKDVDRWPSKGGAKTSIGPVGNGAVHLPGAANGPICIAEGPETGLTIWAATGYQTLILLGGLRRAERMAPAGRRVILCRDDDKRSSPGAKSVKAALRRLRAKGIVAREATPFKVRRGDKGDFNDLCKERGLAAVRERIDMAATDAAHVTAFINVADARTQVDTQVKNFFDLVDAKKEGTESDEPAADLDDNVFDPESVAPAVEPPQVHALGITVGVGKTEAALRHALRTLLRLREAGDERAIVIAVPEHKLSDKVAARFRKLVKQAGVDLRVDVWRGREADLAGGEVGEKMCADIETVREAQKLVADIDKEVCKGKREGAEDAPCPYFESCAYRDQLGRNADLWIVSHQILFHSLPKPIEARGVAALVVDESPWRAGIVGAADDDAIEVEPNWIDSQFVVTDTMDGQRLAEIRRLMAMAIARAPEGPVKRETLSAVGFDSETGPFAEREEWRRKQGGGCWRDRIDNASLRPLTLIWKAVAALMACRGPEASGRLTIARRKEDGVRVLRVSGLESIGEGWRVPTLLIDAVLDVELVRPFWPQVENVGQFDVGAPNQTVCQIAGKSWAKGYLEPPNELKRKKAKEAPQTPQHKAKAAKTASNAKAAEKSRRRAKTIILKRHRELGGKLLVIGNKAVVQAMQFPPDVYVGWFGAIAGHDEWRDVRLVAILGRPMPSPQAVERMAGAMTGAAPMTIDGWYQRGDAYHLRRDGDGVVRVLAESDIHPDPIAERMRQRICIGEIEQAIGRSRGVNRVQNDPVEILVLGDAILPVPVDEFLSDDALWPTPTDYMLAEGGIGFADGTSASMAYPHLWRTGGAARQAFQREWEWAGNNQDKDTNSVTFPYNNIPIGKGDADRLGALVIPVRFQRAGPKLHVENAVYDPSRVANPRDAIEAMLGPLVMFEAMGQREDEEASSGEAEADTLATRILAALASGPMARGDLTQKLKRYADAGQLAEEISNLLEAGQIISKLVDTGKRPALIYRRAKFAPKPEEAPSTAPTADELPSISISDAVLMDEMPSPKQENISGKAAQGCSPMLP